MEHVLVIILLLIAFLSFIPVINMFRNKENKKYRCLKYLINTAFVWTLLILLERLSGNLVIVYYAHVVSYPLKFLLASFMVCTIFNYVEKDMPKAVFYILGILFGVEFLLGVTNGYTNFLLEIKPDQISGFEDLYNANEGPIFIYHLLLTYFVLFIGVGYLFVFLAKNKNVRQYKSITQTMAISVFIVLFFNALQLLVIETNVDLTYVSLIIVSYALYIVIYKKDMVFNLKSSGRGEILSNMREMYILTDADKNVIEISKLLQEQYEVKTINYLGKPLQSLISDLEKVIVFYSEYEVNMDEHNDKKHFHLREKKFTLKGMDDYGFMILMYDETQVFGLLRELNRLSNFDNMTGLNNRNYIETKLEKMNDEKNIGIVSLDLNGLKANNDYLGHERGDYLLKSLAQKMKTVMGHFENKEMARIGGDEFLIVVNNATEELVKNIKEDILKECYDIDLEKFISVSIGTAFSKEKDNIYKLIQQADKDMYDMKQNTSKEYSRKIVAYAEKLDKYIR